jgi:hypothetical protein
VSCIPDLKNEINSLSKDILAEKTKVKALQDELENPLNVHRWRKLEATDQETFERILKIQTLQRRLIAKTEEVIQIKHDIQKPLTILLDPPRCKRRKSLSKKKKNFSWNLKTFLLDSQVLKFSNSLLLIVKV